MSREEQDREHLEVRFRLDSALNELAAIESRLSTLVPNGARDLSSIYAAPTPMADRLQAWRRVAYEEIGRLLEDGVRAEGRRDEAQRLLDAFPKR